jgi:hypothetical protein
VVGSGLAGGMASAARAVVAPDASPPIITPQTVSPPVTRASNNSRRTIRRSVESRATGHAGSASYTVRR